VNAAVSSSGPTPTLRPTHSPKQGKRKKEDEIDEDETTYNPGDKRTEVPPRDSSLFYSNGNPKPIPTGRLLIRKPKSRQAKRLGRRGKGRGGKRFRGGPSGAPGVPSLNHEQNHSPIRTSEANLSSMLFGDPSPSYGPNPNLSQNGHAIFQTSRDHEVEPGSKTGTAYFHSPSRIHEADLAPTPLCDLSQSYGPNQTLA